MAGCPQPAVALDEYWMEEDDVVELRIRRWREIKTTKPGWNATFKIE